MSYWSDFRKKFIKNSQENLASLKELGELLYSKTRHGTDRIAELTKEELEILKQKYRLHNKHNELTETIQDIGDAYLEIYKTKENPSANVRLIEEAKKAVELEEECKKIEKDLKNKNSDPSLLTGKGKETETTPY